MAGTPQGALKAVNTNLKKYGEDYYRKIGKKGGKKGKGYAKRRIENESKVN